VNKRVINGKILEIQNTAGDMILSFDEELLDEVMHIKVAGEVKNEVSHDFEDEIMAAFSVCSRIKIDLSNVTHMSSLAMRALLSVQQIIDDIPNASMVISAVSPTAREMFEESGFIDILCFEQ
jgi:anti-anti-sigma factor